MLKETNTPTRPRIEPGSPDPESDALTIRPVRPPGGGGAFFVPVQEQFAENTNKSYHVCRVKVVIHIYHKIFVIR